MTKTRIQFWNLIEALKRLSEPVPENLTEAIQELPRVPQLLSPWTTWLAFTLIEYRRRQVWAHQILCEHLAEYMPPNRRLVAEVRTDFLSLPTFPDWKVEQFFSCGMGWANLINNDTEECISLSISGVDHLVFPDCFREMLKPTSRWQAASRLLELHQSPHTLTYAIDDLEGVDFLLPVNFDGEHETSVAPEAHMLTTLATSCSDQFERFLTRWMDANTRLWLAAVIGDWLAAAELARDTGDNRLIMECSARAEHCRHERLAIARFGLQSWSNCHIHLHVLRDLGAEDVDDRVSHWLAAALEDQESESRLATFLRETDDPKWCPQMFTLMESACMRLGKDSDAIASQCARFLVRHDYRVDDVVLAVQSREGILADAAVILLKQGVDSAMPIIRRALRTVPPPDSPTSVSRLEEWQCLQPFGHITRTAAMLALFDEAWSRNELYDAFVELNENQVCDRLEILPIILALDTSDDQEANEVANAWLSNYDSDMIEDARDFFDLLVDGSRNQFNDLNLAVSC
jgi:hypothetical protein